MLSPETYHKIVPRDPVKNARFRRSLLDQCEHDPVAQALVLDACRLDITFWVNCFAYQYNPRRVGDEVGPFVLWEFQERVLRRTMSRLFDLGRGDIWEKSREMGATWLALLMDDWLCLFHDRKKVLVISHSEDAVWRPDDPDSLFWKVQFVHAHLPSWMLREVGEKKLSFAYRSTDSYMNGAANTTRSGVGGRATNLLLDEFSKHQQADEILSQTADTGPRLFIGTHYGVGTAFYRMTSRPDAHKEVMHWSEHPEKQLGKYRSTPGLADRERPCDPRFEYPPDFDFVRDGSPTGGPFPGIRSVWYDAEVEARLKEGGTQRDIAMHLDIDAQGATHQFFDALRVKHLVQSTARDPNRTCDPRIDADAAEILELVDSDDGRLALWCHLDYLGRPPAGFYAVGCDLAAGTGATPTCFSAFNWLGEKVAAYVDPHIEPSDAAPLAVALCKLFADHDGGPALLVWENPGPGLKFGQTVLGLGFRHVFRKPKDEFVTVKESSERAGWWNNPQSSRLLLENYRAALYSRDCTNRCKTALEECLDFVYAGNTVEHAAAQRKDDPSGARENHGDRVYADALAWLGVKDRVARGTEPEERKAAERHPGSLAGRRALALANEKKGWLA